MPTVTESPVRAWAHCRDARCPGYAQQEVDAIRQEAAFTFGELGGDGVFTNMTERSTVTFAFADTDEAPCPACGQDREVSGEPRPSYQPLSGHDPMGLFNAPKFDGAPMGPVEESEAEVEARLRAKLREEQIEARLRAEMADS